MRWCYWLTVVLLGVNALAKAQAPVAGALPNAFYALDNSVNRPGLTETQQFDLLKELGYAGVGWHEQAPEQVKATVAELEKRGLKMVTIYCPAQVTPQNDLTHSPRLAELMAALKGHGTIIWIHIGGKGPAFDSLTGQEPLVAKLRALSDLAAINGLKVAIYPHVGEWTARFGDATKLAKIVKHPQFTVTFNLCHCLAMGDEQSIPALLDQAKDILSNVTLSGADSGVQGPKWDRLIQTLDKGTFDQTIVLRKLKQMGFTGPIGFQGYAIAGDARSIVTATMNGWKRISAAMAGG